jgi:hypothetical protein
MGDARSSPFTTSTITYKVVLLEVNKPLYVEFSLNLYRLANDTTLDRYMNLPRTLLFIQHVIFKKTEIMFIM